MRFLKILLGLVLFPLAILMLVGSMRSNQSTNGMHRTMFQRQRDRTSAQRTLEYATSLITGPKDEDGRRG